MLPDETGHRPPPAGGGENRPVREIGLALDLLSRELDVPARTLRHWVQRERELIENRPWPEPAARFLETPEGLDLLHRVFTAAHLVFVQAAVAFFWTMITARLAAWGCDAEVQQWLRHELIPAYYLRRVAQKANTAQERQRLRTLAAEVLTRARSPDGPWGRFDPAQQAELESRARQCADLFQRSSSCVEGRNGQPPLRHHALHHLTARKLQALTVLHNYAVQRADGSTAASRFYGAKPQDLFGWLVRRLSLPARLRATRQAA